MDGDKLKHSGVAQDDRMGMKPNEKAFGYPSGQWSMYVDGRLLRGVEHNATRGMLTTGGGATNNTGALLVRTTARKRALYIPWIAAGTDWYYQDNVLASWQLWAMNQMIASGVCGQYRADVGIYVPPETNVTFYLRVVNGLGTSVYHRYAVPWYEFNADEDIWEYGTGSGAQNPAVGALGWP